ncbi:MAG: DUF4097 family beta strand repeat protein [Opitutaceae bacterium]|nr:DUF4097 family beta strand repeat protein [Opitutaceae bacterium]
MKLRRLFGFLLIALLSTGIGRAMQRVEQQRFALGPGGTVRLDTYRGAIHVTARQDQGDQVEVNVRYATLETKEVEARQALDGLQLTMAADQGDVVITARNPRETGLRIDLFELKRLEISFELVVPARCNLELVNEDGSITVGDLSGTVKAVARTGTVFLRHIDGDVQAQTGSGNVIVSRCTGSVYLKSTRGSLQVGTVGGRARLETVDGDIEIMNALGEVMAHATNGDVSAQFAQVSGDSRLRAAVGNVTTIINPEASFALKASSRWGKIYNDMQLAAARGGSGRGRLSGVYGLGGPLLEIEAPGGNVRIKAGEPQFDE